MRFYHDSSPVLANQEHALTLANNTTIPYNICICKEIKWQAQQLQAKVK